MNHLLIKNEIARVEQALAVRLNKSKVNILQLNMMDSGKWSPLELKTLNRLIAIAHSLKTTEVVTTELLNEVVAVSNLLVTLFETHRKSGSKFGRTPGLASSREPRTLNHSGHELALGIAGIQTGSHENVVGQYLSDD